MKPLPLIVSLAALTAAACATTNDSPEFADTAPDTHAVATAPDRDAEAETEVAEERICRRERVTGSNRPRRICYTRSQREEQEERARDQMHSRSNTCFNCGAGN